MSQLLEHILNGDYVSANELFEERMVELQEQKLYEVKRMIQEQTFPSGVAGVEARKKAGFRKASDVLGDPTEGRKGTGTKKPKQTAAADEWKKMSFGQKKSLFKRVKASVEKKSPKLVSEPTVTRGTTRPKDEPKAAAPTPTPSRDMSVMKQTPEKTGTRRERLAKAGLKMLDAKSGASKADTQSRYEKDLERAKGLAARGHSNAVSRVKKAYAGHRLATGVGRFAKGAAQFVAGALQSAE